MTASLRNIASTVGKLPAKERAYLAERLIASLEDADIEQQWASAAVQRRDEVRSGRIKPIPSTVVYRQIERLLAK